MTKMQPLTDEQRVFAAKHHALVFQFLYINRLSEDDYDVAIFGYLRAVQNYLTREDLRQYAFSTIAFRAMSSNICHECRKRRTRPQELSILDAPLSKEGTQTLADCIADDEDPFTTILDLDEMERLLACCTGKQRELLIHWACGATGRELAARNGCGMGAIYSRVHRCKRQVREANA